MAEKIRAAGYVRVSTSQQAQGESLTEQTKKVERLAEYEGWDLVEVYEDAGRSGRNVDRPALQRMLGALDSVDRIVVPRLDRLGRSATQLFRVYEALDAAEVGLVSVREKFDTGTAQGKLMRSLLSALAELESDQIAERLEDFNRRKIEQNLHNGGPRPFGYRWAGGNKLEVVPEEAVIVERIFSEFVGGDSMHQIAKRLQAEKVPTARMNGVWTEGSGRWTTARVRERLESVVYQGDLGSRLHDNVRPGSHEAIVSRSTFAKAAARRQAQQTQSGQGRGRATNALLPGGFFRCGLCGCGMRPKYNRNTYRCSGRDELHNGCELPSIPRDKVDDALRTYFLTYVFDPDASRVEYEAERERATAEARESWNVCLRGAAQAKTRRANIKTLMQDGKLPADVWAEQDADLAGEHDELAAQAETAKRRLDALLAPDDARFEDWQSLRESALGDLTKDSDREQLRAVLQRLFEFISVAEVNPDPAPGEPPLPDDLPTFEYRGKHFALWLETRPEALAWIEPDDPEGGDPFPDGVGPVGLPLRPEARNGKPMRPSDPDGDVPEGRNGSALRTSSRIEMPPWPPPRAGRASSRTTWGCPRRSSAVSSTVTMRSAGCSSDAAAPRVVVLPAPVPPATRIERRSRTASVTSSATAGVQVPRSTSSSGVQRRARKRRIVTAGPSTATGGNATWTREPSGSRASHRGSERSTRRPAPASMRSIACSSSCSSANATPVSSMRPRRSTQTGRVPLIMISSISSSSSSDSNGPSPTVRSRSRRRTSSRSSGGSSGASRRRTRSSSSSGDGLMPPSAGAAASTTSRACRSAAISRCTLIPCPPGSTWRWSRPRRSRRRRGPGAAPAARWRSSARPPGRRPA